MAIDSITRFSLRRRGEAPGDEKLGSWGIEKNSTCSPQTYTANMQPLASLLIFLSCCVHATLAVSPEVRAILMEFYQSTNGPFWYNTQNNAQPWGVNGTDPCTWGGITCNGASEITQIAVINNNLNGPIPNSFFNLTNLTRIDLSVNYFSDGLKLDFGRMTQLTFLNFAQYSTFTQVTLVSLPSSLTELSLAGLPVTISDEIILSIPRINFLDLSRNPLAANLNFYQLSQCIFLNQLLLSSIGLTGTVPAWMFQRTTYLKLDGNELTLDVPRGCIVQQLDFSGNQAQGPLPNISLCHALFYADLSDNQYTGLISLPSPCPLQMLDLSGNLFTNISDISQCTSLVTMRLSGNQISGPIPNVTLMSSLQNLYLDSNQFTGELRDEFQKSPLLNIDLSTNLLTGTLPPSLFQSSKIQSIILKGNTFYGSVPSFQTPSLQTFDVSYNNLSGGFTRFPPSLVSLYLHYNQFEGLFPDVSNITTLLFCTINNNAFSGPLFNISYVTYFDASHNQFTGSIPLSYHNNPHLYALILDYNLLDGPLPYLNLSFVYFITLSNNRFSGTLPSPLCSSYQFLLTLDLSHNNFTGDLRTFQFPRNFYFLKHLDLSYNHFSGSLFDSQAWIFNANRYWYMQYFDLSHNQFSTPIFGSVVTAYTLDSSLPIFLTYIDLSYNQFYGTPNLQQNQLSYTGLLTVILSNNKLSGNAINTFTYFPSIQDLDLSNNLITGAIPSSLGSLIALTHLNLSSTLLNGKISSIAISRLSSLEVLDLHNNTLAADDLSWIGGMSRLQYADLSYNRFTGSLPPASGLIQLKTFDLSNNQVRGTVDGYCNIKTLNQFIVNNNLLNGTVCSFIGDITTLNLSQNLFSGDISFLSSMTSLQSVDISSNQFSRQLPSLTRLGKLANANFSRNLLVGTIPSLSDLSTLVSIDLSHNQFNDTLPQFTESNGQLSLFDVSYNDITWGSEFYLPNNNVTCSMVGNHFECPISLDARDRCNASCVATSELAANISIKVSGDLSTFNSTRFIQVIASLLAASENRFHINRLRSGSVIVDLTISPPPNQSGEGSAVTLVDQMQDVSFKSSLTTRNYTLLDVSPSIPDPIVSVTDVKGATSNSNTNTYIIVGVVVGAFVIITVVALLAVTHYMRKRNATGPHQVVMIDMSTMNLTDVKQSLIQYEELENMEMIGSGAFGIVFGAQWRGIKVAVKQVKAEYVDEYQVKEFLHEVAVMQNLRPHPHVVLFMGITLPPSPLSIITEYCGGGSLLTYLRQNPELPLDQKMKFIMQIAQGMLHLHMEKIIHRDLAVRNILLTSHLDAKVADFGMSRQQDNVDNAQTTATTIGPIRWMAPEAITERKYSTKTDVFSFGVLVWEIVTNKEPFEGIDNVLVAVAVIKEDARLQIPDDTDILLKKLMDGCWKTAPIERPNFRSLFGMQAPEGADEVFAEEDLSGSGSEIGNPDIHYDAIPTRLFS
ncbi:CLL4A clavata1-like receptor S/T protein kinase protein [Planoprotostelium fungivorum]|uniref:CLL4A clavata1-like receptor S/T protein kinase protein n=1 Tax=Planoprotostelium fungivorum TaxID=1890364 RepID=A0A2P6NHQ2_9EUKA|nr:CLL4A clavata1-like receptor S/T protein kinase protein [Planoprotostelium fungivorum]